MAASGEYRLAWNLRYALKLPTRLLNAIYPLFRSYLKAPPKVLKAMHAESVSKWNGWSLFRDLQVPTLVIQRPRRPCLQAPRPDWAWRGPSPAPKRSTSVPPGTW